MPERVVSSSAAGVRWDLTRVVSDAAAAHAAIDDAQRHAALLQPRAHEIEQLDGAALRTLLDQANELAELRDLLDEQWGYAGLRLLADMTDVEARDLATACENALPAVRDALRAVALGLGDLPTAGAAREVAPYRHWIEHQAALRSQRMHPEAETAFAARAPSASTAWGRLSQEILTSASVDFDAGTGERPMGRVELRLLRYDRDRDVRRRAEQALIGVYEHNLPVVAACLDAIVADRLAEDRLRVRTDPLEATLIVDEVPSPTVDLLLRAIEDRTDVLDRWFERKRQALGLDRLATHDRFAPVGEPPVVTWSDAVETCGDVFASLSPALAPVARAVFEERRVDAERRPGKGGGVFCAPLPRGGAFVFNSYFDTPRGALVLAHELGHAVHFDRAAAGTPWLALMEPASAAFFEIPSTLAELAAAEHLHVMLGVEQGKAALREALEGVFTHVFFVVASMRFEREMYACRAAGSALTPERIDEAWLRCECALYGDLAQRLAILHGPHVFVSRFYSYQYAYATLAALRLLEMRRDDPERFGRDYVAMLDATGSGTPAQLLARCGLDTDDAGLWERGLVELDRLCDLAW